MSQVLAPGNWILRLNNMTHAHIEDLTLVCFAETREELETFVRGQRVPLYTDGRYVKTFKKDGPLEWFNSPDGWAPNYVQWLPKEPTLAHVSELEGGL